MLSLSHLSNTNGTESKNEMVENFSVTGAGNSFPDFSGESLLSSIDFDDLFSSINDGDHVLPDLEMDSEIIAEVSSLSAGAEILAEVSSLSAGEQTKTNTLLVSAERLEDDNDNSRNKDEKDKVSGSSNDTSGSNSRQGEEIVSKRDESSVVSLCPKESADIKRRISSAQSKNPQGKRKVDWTPELHRRFVQAVEQLGVDKAVPSRILALMGIDFLTRHNIASHLQKYRSHRKHMLAREAEAASWNQRRQMYPSTPTAAGGWNKRDGRSPWLAPTIGFPPVVPFHHFRPLHVWGHPSMDQSLVNMWPKHLVPSPPPPPTWPKAAPPSNPPAPPPYPKSLWHSQHHQRVLSSSLTPETPCFQQPLAATRFLNPPVPGIPPPLMYSIPSAPTGQTTYTNPPFDLHPSKESIDASIGDVLLKRWLPFPLGLKPPSVDGVLMELQRQGISKVPPTASCS